MIGVIPPVRPQAEPSAAALALTRWGARRRLDGLLLRDRIPRIGRLRPVGLRAAMLLHGLRDRRCPTGLHRRPPDVLEYHPQGSTPTRSFRSDAKKRI